MFCILKKVCGKLEIFFLKSSGVGLGLGIMALQVQQPLAMPASQVRRPGSGSSYCTSYCGHLKNELADGRSVSLPLSLSHIQK